MASSTSWAGISRSVPSIGSKPASPIRTWVSRRPRTLPSASPRISVVLTAYIRSPPSSWAQATRKSVG